MTPATASRQASSRMTEELKWTFDDGWILMSVFFNHGQDGASLDDLIVAADLMNHAIPTRSELSRSLSRLASCGVLVEVDSRYRISEEYLPMLAKAYQGRGGMFSTPDKGTKWLSRMKFEVIEAPAIQISAKQLRDAIKRYHQLFRQE